MKANSLEPLSIAVYDKYDLSDSSYDMHYLAELGIVVEGSMIRDHTGEEIVYSKGNVWLTASWEPHGFRLVEVPCKVIVILADPLFLSHADVPLMNWLPAFSISPAERKNANTASTSAEVLRIAGRILNTFQSGKKIEPIIIKQYLTELLLLLYTDQLIEHPKPLRYATDIYQTVEKSINLIIENKRYIPVEEAANICNMNRIKFARLFSDVMGISFARFGLNHRLGGAYKELLTTRKTIEHIANEWGFTDSSHLTRIFKTQFGRSPGNLKNEVVSRK